MSETIKFKPEGDKALARKPLFVKVPQEILDAVESLPSGERSTWLRQIVVSAVQKELINKKNQSYPT